MRQPNSGRWQVIWTIAVLLVLAWPSDDSPGLGIKALNWIADPLDTLPTLPPPLPMAQEDDAVAVLEHDQALSAYFTAESTPGLMRVRLRLKELRDPFDPSTERQLLGGIGILTALYIWRRGSSVQAS